MYCLQNMDYRQKTYFVIFQNNVIDIVEKYSNGENLTNMSIHFIFSYFIHQMYLYYIQKFGSKLDQFQE